MSGRVLITRELALCGALPDLLRNAGHTLFGLSVTDTEFLSPMIPESSTFDCIAFTSANAVRGLARLFDDESRSKLAQYKLAAVGKSTAQVIEENFHRAPDLVSKISDGAHLAANMADAMAVGSQVLYPCASDHDAAFTHTCRARGLVVTELPVYRTLGRPVENVARELKMIEPFDAVLFYAPSAVRSFRAARPDLRDFAAVAIGPTTLVALREAGFDTLVLSANTSPEALLRAVEEGLTINAKSTRF